MCEVVRDQLYVWIDCCGFQGVRSSLVVSSMALSMFMGRRNNLWDMADPLDVMASMVDNAAATWFARDCRAVASTNVDWKETATEHVTFKADLPGLPGLQEREVQKTDAWHRVERSSGQFMRKSGLPENAYVTEDGVLPEETKNVSRTRSEVTRMTTPVEGAPSDEPLVN